MKNVPDWVIGVIDSDKLCCNKCKKILSVDDLSSIGIQESVFEPYGDKLCVGLICPECREITVFELKEMTLIEFAFEILDKETEVKKTGSAVIPDEDTGKKDVLKELLSDRHGGKKHVNKKSKITKKEVNEVVRFLKDTKTHEDFLLAMGMSPEQISKCNYKKGEEE